VRKVAAPILRAWLKLNLARQLGLVTVNKRIAIGIVMFLLATMQGTMPGLRYVKGLAYYAGQHRTMPELSRELSEPELS